MVGAVSGLDAIANTPVVRLDRLAGDNDAEVWVKLEAGNPTGSYKDPMSSKASNREVLRSGP
jgi:cysteine synthase A